MWVAAGLGRASVLGAHSAVTATRGDEAAMCEWADGSALSVSVRLLQYQRYWWFL